ncbi:MAG TPA: pyruvate ferredoxin oxidoreductase [Firmicutes bacterium]|nr:MAG: pyruvate ferredoxin oxidoreductase [Candidatus Omnitrophota bacterium]HDD64832.1 pyruvate ferredoxin oxidoreductase [Bacillota bacterium]
MKVAKTANEAFAEAMRQINPDVVAAYPITPATEIVQIFSQFVADGLVKTEFIAVESEHSAMSACIGASASGARTMTGTSSQGLALMWEMLYIASALRLPIIMAVVNRALSAPINIHCDHSDTLGARDSGWIQIYSENVQETYDNVIQAVRIAEHPDVRLPVMVTTDGFILSHCLETMDMLTDEEVKEFVGEPPERENLLKSAREDKPITIGALDLQDYYFEHKRQQAEAMKNALKVIPEIGKEFGEKFGRSYGFFENYRLDDAEVGIVVMGSTAGTGKEVVDEMRKKGKKVGLLKLRIFRPFPFNQISQALSHLKVVGVMDRADGVNSYCGPLFPEICTSLYDLPERPKVVDFIYGLGGRDIKKSDIEGIFNDLLKIAETGKKEFNLKYIGVRE